MILDFVRVYSYHYIYIFFSFGCCPLSVDRKCMYFWACLCFCLRVECTGSSDKDTLIVRSNLAQCPPFQGSSLFSRPVDIQTVKSISMIYYWHTGQQSGTKCSRLLLRLLYLLPWLLLLTVVRIVCHLVRVPDPGIGSTRRSTRVPAGVVRWSRSRRACSWCSVRGRRSWFNGHGHRRHWHTRFLAELQDEEASDEEEGEFAEDQSFQSLHADDGHKYGHKSFELQLD